MGKSLQPQKAIAVRQPANTPAPGPAAATPAPNEPVTVESLGWQLRAALPPLRLHSVSIYDEQANVLWLSEGALGPDEHNVVVEGVEALGSDSNLSYFEAGLEDGRISIFLPVRSPQGGLVGLAMILADIKSVGDGVVERMITPQVRTIMQKVAVLLRPLQPRGTQTESLKILELAPEIDAAPMQASPPKPATSVSSISPVTPAARNAPVIPAAAPSRTRPPPLSPQAVDDILEFELTPDLPSAVPHSHTQRVPALTAVNGAALSLDLPTAKAAAKPAAPVLSAAPVVSAAPTPAAAPFATTPAGAISVAAAPAKQVAAAPIAPVTAAPVAAAPIVAPADHSAPLASLVESFDLNLPALDPPERPTVFAGNVAQFPVAAPAIPTAAPSTSTTMNGSALAPPVSSGSTTSKTLTGASKAFGASDTAKTTGATTTSRVFALPDGVSLILEVLPFSKLRTGGRTRRYEVLARSSHPNRVPSGFDKIALQQLLAWMGTNRAAWNLEPTSFTLNLSISTLEDERFPQFVASQLKANGIAPDNVGFEIAEPLCLQRRAQVERFITLCDKLGCFVVIDDFSLDSSITGLLRSKALRLVKIDPKLTSVALKDKLAQAMVVAIAQAVKVLGIHCAAKRVESQASLQWLTAIGCDFAQGSALAQVQPLESLGAQPATGPSQPA
jgi:EAL domain-containing protein (putative c-di-GMP-specific phosphodiesterase class I)